MLVRLLCGLLGSEELLRVRGHHARVAPAAGHHWVHAHHHGVRHHGVEAAAHHRLPAVHPALLHLLELLLLEFVELPLALLRESLLALPLGQGCAEAALALAFSFVGGDGAKETGLGRWGLERYVDERCARFPCELFLFLRRAILLVLHTRREKAMGRERLRHRRRRGLHLDKGLASTVARLDIPIRVQDLAPDRT